MAPFEEAAARLEEVGLTEYEARCFVALSRVSDATAKELSRMADVPRSRVYDTVERLSQRGLVDVQQSSPRRFRAVPSEAAFERLRRDFESTLEAADAAVAELATQESAGESGTWSISDRDHVIDRAVGLIDEAESAIHLLVAGERTVEDRLLDRLAAASSRDVTVVVETSDEEVRARVAGAVPDADVVIADDLEETELVVDRWPGLLLLVDERAVLASGITDDRLPGVDDEAAVWTHGRDHGFATWIRELLANRLAASTPEK